MKTEETTALGILLALSALAVLGVTALDLWSWVSSGLIAAASFCFVRAMLTDTRKAPPAVNFRFDFPPPPVDPADIDRAARAAKAAKEGLH